MQKKEPVSMINRTYREQVLTEKVIKPFFERYALKCLQGENFEDFKEEEEDIKNAVSHFLLRHLHGEYLRDNLKSTGFFGKALDNGQPWMAYWILNAMDVLDEPPGYLENPTIVQKCLQFLEKCQSPLGGFQGGTYQMAHLAPTYASILSILILGSEEGYKMVNREKMYEFLMSMRNPALKGSFLMSEKGECDMRAAYIAMITADILNIMTDELKDGVGDYIASLQSYEGGLGATPSEEAHGGYTYCGFAGLCCIGETHKVDLHKLQWYICARQLPIEGGFNGRTAKVVDACYTFWVGALFHLINIATGNKIHNDGKLLCDQLKVQMYALLCCQDHEEGGLKDKPGKYADYYHTNYTLSGLSGMQSLIGTDEKLYFRNLQENKLKDIDWIFGVEKSKVEKARKYFQSLPKIK